MASAALGTAFRHLRDLFGAGSVIGLEDGQLLARYSGSKDPVAFEALVNRHGPMVLATCRAVLKNEHDVEDAFQATFLVLAKKARSIRGGDALGGWLHRVAYRASVQASLEAKRRRRKEAEALAMAPLDASRPGFEPDVKPILHEEIDRLPEGQRLPVVLCDLEGLTYEQAAEQLRWTVPTLRCRLAKARQKLKARLTRRGITGLAVGASLVPKGASASVPPALIKATVAAATGGAASAGAALLTQTLLKGMLMTKLKIASTAALAALALASAGLIAAGAGRPDDPKPAMKPKAAAKAEVAVKDAPIAKKPMEMVEIKGRVVAPDGKPVAGATVRGAYLSRDIKPLPMATSGPDGRFIIRLPRPSAASSEGHVDRYPWLLASAPGYGVGWTERVLRPDRPDEQVVRLIEEGPPIEGRIIDLEGRVVAGATIRANRIWFDAQGDLPSWIAKARKGSEGNVWQGLENLPLDEILAIEAKTGPDGRFKLTGIGRDRIADLIVSGSGIATTQVNVLSRDVPEIRTSDKSMMMFIPFVVHAPKFQLALAPSKRVEGVARDKDTGRPIAGLEIKAGAFAENDLSWAEGVKAKTDAEGRYRLDGLPKAAAYRLFVTPGKGMPYVSSTLKAPADSRAMEPVAFDFTLASGILVSGTITDKVTGKPVWGQASYYAFSDNPNLKDFLGFTQGYPQYADVGEDGRYELVALPGRGLIAFRESNYLYRPASGYEKIEGYVPQAHGFRTVPQTAFEWGFNIFAEVVADPKAKSLVLDLQADPGKSVAVDVISPDGQPLGGTKVRGIGELYQTGAHPQESASFEVHALDPSTPRRVIITHEKLKLIGSAILRGDERGPVVIKLQPSGTVTGRIVDEEGQPRKAMFIGNPGGSFDKLPQTHGILPDSDWNSGIRVDDDGRFLVEGLVPGLKYSATSRTGFEAYGDLFVDVTVAPGEVKDLGDLKVQPPKKQED